MAKRPHSKGPRMMKEKKEYEEEVLQVDRVTRVVKGGRRLRFRATVVIGNRKGKVAIGIGKATEVSEAIKKAVTKAKKSIVRVPMIKETIPFAVKSKFKASHVLMMPAAPGTGIKAGSSTRKILELAGVKNILAKSLGSNNRINIAKATMIGIEKLYEKDLPEEAFKAPKEERKAGPKFVKMTSKKPVIKEGAKTHKAESATTEPRTEHDAVKGEKEAKIDKAEASEAEKPTENNK